MLRPRPRGSSPQRRLPRVIFALVGRLGVRNQQASMVCVGGRRPCWANIVVSSKVAIAEVRAGRASGGRRPDRRRQAAASNAGVAPAVNGATGRWRELPKGHCRGRYRGAQAGPLS